LEGGAGVSAIDPEQTQPGKDPRLKTSEFEGAKWMFEIISFFSERLERNPGPDRLGIRD
jgi:hypothetical protein